MKCKSSVLPLQEQVAFWYLLRYFPFFLMKWYCPQRWNTCYGKLSKMPLCRNCPVLFTDHYILWRHLLALLSQLRLFLHYKCRRVKGRSIYNCTRSIDFDHYIWKQLNLLYIFFFSLGIQFKFNFLFPLSHSTCLLVHAFKFRSLIYCNL